MEPQLRHPVKNSALLKPSTGWKKGRILLTRLILLPLGGLILFTSHRANCCLWLELTMAGVGLLLTHQGIRGRVWSTLYIGGRKDSSLVTEGPYSLTRNPLYFYSGLAALGISLASGVWSVVAIIAGGYALISWFTIKAEERKLSAIYGADFSDYCSRVPSFFPRVGTAPVVATSQFNPKNFHRTYDDATWFIIAWIVVGVMHLLKAMNIIPTLLLLP